MNILRKNKYTIISLSLFVAILLIGIGLYHSHSDKANFIPTVKDRQPDSFGDITVFEDSVIECSWVNGAIVMQSAPSANQTKQIIPQTEFKAYLQSAAKRHLCVF